MTPTLTHHPECNDITRCRPDCAFAQERASEDPDTQQHHERCKDLPQCHPFCALAGEPDISFGEGKKFSPDEIREQGGEFGDSIADFMQEQGLDHISFEPGDEE